MARTLSKKPPTSSVARLFNREAASRALAASRTQVCTEESPNNRMPLPPDRIARAAVIKREFVLTPETEDTLMRLVQVYRRATGTRLSNSHVLRVVLRGIQHGLAAIEREANVLGTLKLPSNAKGREVERERFENALASNFIAAMRTLPAYGHD